jgi:SNF2 family DNA or RNA helicase
MEELEARFDEVNLDLDEWFFAGKRGNENGEKEAAKKQRQAETANLTTEELKRYLAEKKREEMDIRNQKDRAKSAIERERRANLSDDARALEDAAKVARAARTPAEKSAEKSAENEYKTKLKLDETTRKSAEKLATAAQVLDTSNENFRNTVTKYRQSYHQNIKEVEAEVTRFIKNEVGFSNQILSKTPPDKIIKMEDHQITFIAHTFLLAKYRREDKSINTVGGCMIMNHAMGTGKTMTASVMMRIVLRVSEVYGMRVGYPPRYNAMCSNYPTIMECFETETLSKTSRVLVIANNNTLNVWTNGIESCNSLNEYGDQLIQVESIVCKDAISLNKLSAATTEQVIIIPNTISIVSSDLAKSKKSKSVVGDKDARPPKTATYSSLADFCEKMNICMFVMDEVHTLLSKNRMKNIKYAVNKTPKVMSLGLSGTPLMNNPKELFKLLETVSGIDINVKQYIMGQSLMIKPFQILVHDYVHEVDTQTLVEMAGLGRLNVVGVQFDRMLFRDQAEALTYNGLVRQIKNGIVEKGDDHGEHFDDSDNDDTDDGGDVKKKRTKGTSNVAVAIGKLRDFMCDPDILKIPESENKFTSADAKKLKEFSESSPKTLAIIDIMEKSEVQRRNKFVIASVSVKYLEILKYELERFNTLDTPLYTVYMYTGNNSKDRQADLELFMASSAGKQNKQVLLLSMMAGAEGIHAVETAFLERNCADMIFANLWWNKGKIAQTIGRIYRRGQFEDRQVNVYIPYILGTIEENIKNLIREKQGKVRMIMKAGHEYTDKSVPLSNFRVDKTEEQYTTNLTNMIQEIDLGDKRLFMQSQHSTNRSSAFNRNLFSCKSIVHDEVVYAGGDAGDPKININGNTNMDYLYTDISATYDGK